MFAAVADSAIQDPTALLIAAVGALASALIFVARTIYAEKRAENEFLRRDVLAALTAIIGRMNEVARERDGMVGDLSRKLEAVRRLMVTRTGRDG